jgi:hypothetical protein
MRCVLVSDANLKADACCTYCRTKISDNYVREIGNRFIYCSYDCFQDAAATPLAIPGGRVIPINSCTVNS